MTFRGCRAARIFNRSSSCLACGVSAGAVPDPLQPTPHPGALAMVAMIIRFIEELIDVLNFGNHINK